MPAYRIPVLVWTDHEGFVSAAPVENELSEHSMVAVDTTLSAALNQLESFLAWHYKKDPYAYEPDFLDPKLLQVKVQVRPQYVENGRVYPCDEPVELRVPCVVGRQENGSIVCSLPTLEMGIYLHDEKSVKQMVSERVRNHFEDATPAVLAQMLPPASVQLETVTARAPRRARSQRLQQRLPTLQRIAQAIGHVDFRKSYSAAWQRETEVADLANRLGHERANVALVGEHGVGKSTLLVAAVRSLERSHAKEAKDNREPERYRVEPVRHRYWLTSAARIIAGMKYLGEWQERCEQVIIELGEIDGVLCVENLLDLLLVGGAGPNDSLGAFFLPYLQRGELRLAGEATPAELDAMRRLLPGFADVMQILRVEELGRREACAALGQVADNLSRGSKVTIAKGLAGTVYRLFHRFMPYRAMPGRASAFVHELFEQARQERRKEIELPMVIARFIRETGLPEHLACDDQPLEVDSVEASLKERVIGQESACETMAELVATFKAGLNDPTRPVGALLFCGPTGVGKTELAKVTSSYLFGHGKNTDRLVRLDMSEYSSPWSAERLITKEDRTPSDFINRIRQQPFVVVLLDEIEKAAPEVHDILLGVLDEGRLTDRYGRTTNFRSAIIIMTSNLGASANRSIGFSGSASHDYESDVRAFFRPEFFNRLDALLAFSPLSFEVCRKIVRKELGDIQQREGLAKANLALTFTDSLVEHLVETGFDARYGARPLQRTIETTVVSVVSRHLVNNPGIRDAEIRLDIGRDATCVIL